MLTGMDTRNDPTGFGGGLWPDLLVCFHFHIVSLLKAAVRDVKREKKMFCFVQKRKEKKKEEVYRISRPTETPFVSHSASTESQPRRSSL